MIEMKSDFVAFWTLSTSDAQGGGLNLGSSLSAILQKIKNAIDFQLVNNVLVTLIKSLDRAHP